MWSDGDWCRRDRALAGASRVVFETFRFLAVKRRVGPCGGPTGRGLVRFHFSTLIVHMYERP